MDHICASAASLVMFFLPQQHQQQLIPSRCAAATITVRVNIEMENDDEIMRRPWRTVIATSRRTMSKIFRSIEMRFNVESVGLLSFLKSD
jgi:hypothetical protein